MKILLPAYISFLAPTFENRLMTIILPLFLSANIDGLLIIMKVDARFDLG